MAWDSAVVTNAGAAMLNDIIDHNITLDYAAGGTSTMPEVELMAATGLTAEKQRLAVVGAEKTDQGEKIHVLIENKQLETGYTMNQLGIWAHVGESEPQLFCILQDNRGLDIPSKDDIPDFSMDFYSLVCFTNTEPKEFKVVVPGDALVSQAMMQKAMDGLREETQPVTLQGSGPPGTETVGQVGQRYLDATTGKEYYCSAAKEGSYTWLQLGAVDDELSETSTNPVQNKVVNAALGGKAPTKHTHTAADFTGTLPVAKGGTGAVDAAAARANLGAQAKIGSKTFTIPTTGWVGNKLTLTVNGVTADPDQIVNLSIKTKAGAAIYAAAGIWFETKGLNTLTLSCDQPPKANIEMEIVITN